MSSFRISRRRLIARSGAVFTLPLLEALFPRNVAWAQAVSDPRRYVGVYFPNGTVNRAQFPSWYPATGLITSATLSPVFQSYPTYMSDISVHKHLKLNRKGGDDHEAGSTFFFTAEANMTTATNSFEWIISDIVKKDPIIIHSGNTKADLPLDEFTSYRNGKGQKGYSNPGDLYRALLTKIAPSSPMSVAPTAPNTDRSIIDSALGDFNELRAKVGKNDQLKLDEYLSGLRDLERKIAASLGSMPSGGGAQAASCQSPSLSSTVDDTTQSPSLYLPKFYAFNDLIKIAFACDVSRSVNIMTDTETSERSLANAPGALVYQGYNIGGSSSHTAISHASNIDQRIGRCMTRDRVLLGIVTDLMTKLKGTKDPSGSSMLDNTIIHAGFGVEDGNHWSDANLGSPVGHPILTAGARNFLKTGFSHDLSGSTLQDLFFTFSKHLNLGLTSFRGSSKMLPI